MEERPSGYFDDTLIPILDDGPTPGDDLELGSFFEKAQANEAGVIVDPGLTTTLAPFPPGTTFLTPSSTSISPRSSVDYFADHSRTFSVGSDAFASHDLASSNDFLFNKQPEAASASPSTARRRGKIVARASEQVEGNLRLSLAPSAPFPAPVPAPAPISGPGPDLVPNQAAPYPALDMPSDTAPGPSSGTRTRKRPLPNSAKQTQTSKRKGGRTAKKADAQRSKNLERNRIAASKCRQKKKEWMTELEEAKDELEQRHNALRLEYLSLVQEVNDIKTTLMSHFNCQDANINFWIEREAVNYVAKCNAARNVQMSQNLQNSPSGPSASHGPAGSGSGSVSQLLPSPSESLDAPVASPEFNGLGINLDYMPDELLAGEPL